jgi:hypothetical protein
MEKMTPIGETLHRCVFAAVNHREGREEQTAVKTGAGGKSRRRCAGPSR